MHAVDSLHGKLIEQSFLDHDPGAAFVLLGWLKNQVDGAGKVRVFRQVPGRAEQHGRVPVVTAGVHYSRVL